MTEVWIVDDCGTLINMQTRDTFDYVSDVCGELNERDKRIGELNDENENLKLKCEIYQRLSEIRNVEIHNRILTIQDYINDCEDENVKQELKRLFYSEVKEYDLSKELRELEKENHVLNAKVNRLMDELANCYEKLGW